MLKENLQILRKRAKLTQEQAASQIGVSRQALSKWESGESQPDIENCMALAELYNVTLDDLVRYDSESLYGLQIPPRGKHCYGVVRIGERGEIMLPREAMALFHLKTGDSVMLLADESQGLALVQAEAFLGKQSMK